MILSVFMAFCVLLCFIMMKIMIYVFGMCENIINKIKHQNKKEGRKWRDGWRIFVKLMTN